MSNPVTSVLEDAGFDKNADGYVYAVWILIIQTGDKMIYVGETTQNLRERFSDHQTIRLSGNDIVCEFNTDTKEVENAKESDIADVSENSDGTYTVRTPQQSYVKTEMVGNDISLPAPYSHELRSDVAFQLESLHELQNYCKDMGDCDEESHYCNKSCERESHRCDENFAFDDFKSFLRLREKETYDRLVRNEHIDATIVGGK